MDDDQVICRSKSFATPKFAYIRSHLIRLQQSFRRVFLSCPSTTLKQRNWPSPTRVSRSPQGHRYLGGFLAEKDALKTWIQEKAHIWAEAVKELASAAKNYPQSTYSGLQRSLQHEWQFVKRVISDIGDQFTEVVKAISHTFLPALFDEDIAD
jgi:hypothetical protein